MKKSIERKTNLQSENFNDFKESLWDFVANKKVIEKVKVLTGERRYFYIALLCYATQLVQITVGIEIIHITNGIGPDWDDDQKYNVVSVILYLSDTDKTSAGLNLIPYSNKRSYNKTFSNLLR